MEKLYSRKEACDVLGISMSTLDAARATGLLAYVQYLEGGCVYFTEAALMEYIARNTHRAKPKNYNTTSRRKRKVVAR